MLKLYVPTIKCPILANTVACASLKPSGCWNLRTVSNLSPALVLCPSPMAYRAAVPSVTSFKILETWKWVISVWGRKCRATLHDSSSDTVLSVWALSLSYKHRPLGGGEGGMAEGKRNQNNFIQKKNSIKRHNSLYKTKPKPGKVGWCVPVIQHTRIWDKRLGYELRPVWATSYQRTMYECSSVLEHFATQSELHSGSVSENQVL